jgi:hypothetical protein
MLTLERTAAVSMEVGCDGCTDFSGPLFIQLSAGKYGECSVLELPASVQEWRDEHRTARKRASRAERLGHRFSQIAREDYTDDIYAINTSLDIRQGRQMTDAYKVSVRFAPLPHYTCDRHAVHAYGVLKEERLVAYLWLYRSGELALVSSILGHGGYLRDDIMYLLMKGVIDAEAPHGGFLVYNRHDSGTDGLRYYKDRCGFKETAVEWLP